MTRVLIKAELFSIKQSIRWDICKLQHQRRQPQRLHHELRILLVEQGKNQRAARAACILQQIPRRPLQNHNLKLPRFRVRFGALLPNVFVFFECICIVIVSLNLNILELLDTSALSAPLKFETKYSFSQYLFRILLNNNKPEYFPLTICFQT